MQVKIDKTGIKCRKYLCICFYFQRIQSREVGIRQPYWEKRKQESCQYIYLSRISEVLPTWQEGWCCPRRSTWRPAWSLGSAGGRTWGGRPHPRGRQRWRVHMELGRSPGDTGKKKHIKGDYSSCTRERWTNSSRKVLSEREPPDHSKQREHLSPPSVLRRWANLRRKILSKKKTSRPQQAERTFKPPPPTYYRTDMQIHVGALNAVSGPEIPRSGIIIGLKLQL